MIAALAESGVQTRSLDRAAALPTEADMLARDKYTVFSPHARGYRQGVHKVPKWTKLTQRENPRGF